MAAAAVATIKSWHATRGNCLSHKRAVTDQWPPFALLFSFMSSSLLVCQMQMLGYSFSYFWNWRNRGISTEAIERRGTVTVAQHKQSSRFSLALLLRAVATAQLAHLPPRPRRIAASRASRRVRLGMGDKFQSVSASISRFFFLPALPYVLVFLLRLRLTPLGGKQCPHPRRVQHCCMGPVQVLRHIDN